jgi:hypothetical protein
MWIILRAQCHKCELSSVHSVPNVIYPQGAPNVNYPPGTVSKMLIILRAQCPKCELSSEHSVPYVNYPQSTVSQMWIILRAQCHKCELSSGHNVPNVIYPQSTVSQMWINILLLLTAKDQSFACRRLPSSLLIRRGNHALTLILCNVILNSDKSLIHPHFK